MYLAFLKSYFQEKGRNLATKEDVEEITSKIESIKSQVQFSLQAKLSLRAEEHEALVAYYSKYGAWFLGIKDFSLTNVSEDNSERLSELRAELDSLERDFDLATSRMELFVENDDIQSQHGTLAIETLKYHAHAQQITFEFEQQFLKIRQMKLETPQEQQVERYRQLLQEQNDLYRKFKDEHKDFYTRLLPMVNEHRRTIWAHIKSLVREND